MDMHLDPHLRHRALGLLLLPSSSHSTCLSASLSAPGSASGPAWFPLLLWEIFLASSDSRLSLI